MRHRWIFISHHAAHTSSAFTQNIGAVLPQVLFEVACEASSNMATRYLGHTTLFTLLMLSTSIEINAQSVSQSPGVHPNKKWTNHLTSSTGPPMTCSATANADCGDWQSNGTNYNANTIEEYAESDVVGQRHVYPAPGVATLPRTTVALWHFTMAASYAICWTTGASTSFLGHKPSSVRHTLHTHVLCASSSFCTTHSY